LPLNLEWESDMSSKVKLLLICLTLITLSACSASGSKGGRDGDAASFSDDDLALYNEGRYGDGNIPLATEGGPFRTILFDYDSAAIPQEYHGDLQKAASTLKGDP